MQFKFHNHQTFHKSVHSFLKHFTLNKREMKGTSIQELRLGRNLSEQTPDAVFATKNKITNRAIVHRG